MLVDILTPEKKLFSGEVSSITVPGIEGPFTLLNKHAAIISALSKGKLTIVTNEGRQEIAINSGFLECLNNKVVVLVEGSN